ncbi:HAD family phosphatase [Bdellovibrionota bacterium FG-1]
MTEIDTIIFDLDGTLVDTERTAAHAISTCFESWGIHIEASDSALIAGRTWERTFEFLFQKYSLPISQDEAARKMIEAYRHSLQNHLQCVPGSVTAVQTLAQHYPLGLVSGSHRREIFFALDQLKIREHFQVVLGAEDYPNSKPAPDGYIKALGMMNKQAHRTLIFEDSAPGISSGRAAGAWVVAITGTNHFQQDTSHAHHHIADLTGVDKSWIQRVALKLKQL